MIRLLIKVKAAHGGGEVEIWVSGHLPEAEIRRLMREMIEHEPKRNIHVVKGGVDMHIPVSHLEP